MQLPVKKQPSGIGPKKIPVPPPKKDNSIFAGRPSLRPGEHRYRFERGPYEIPSKTYGKIRVPYEKRIGMGKRVESVKFVGPLRDKGDYQRLVKELDKEMRREKDWRKKLQFKKDIEYYRYQGGL